MCGVARYFLALPSSTTWLSFFVFWLKMLQNDLAKAKTDLGPHAKTSILGDNKLMNSLCGIAPMADAGLISIFHPDDKGFASCHWEDVNITYSAPPQSLKTTKRLSQRQSYECGGSPSRNHATSCNTATQRRQSTPTILITPCRAWY